MEETNWVALARMFDGKQTEADQVWFAAWVSANPDRITHVEQLRAHWETAGAIPSRHDEHQAWARLEQAIEETPAPIIRTPIRVGTGLFQHSRARWGAAIGIAAVAALLFVRGANVSIVPSTPQADAAGSTIYATPPGKHAVIQLRDGTEVRLNVASTLEVSSDFGTNNRTVALDGQAVFTVTHAADVPFVVNTPGSRTTVLGTVFGVRAYDSTVQVAVRSGKIALSPCPVNNMSRPHTCNPTGQIVLQASDIAMVTPERHVQVDRGASNALDRAFLWTSGRLVFQNTPVREALGELERWFDVRFVVTEEALSHGHLTTTFNTMQLTDHDIRDLSLLLQAHIERVGNTITIRPLKEQS